MDIIPAIDLLDGKCVRLYQGDYERSETFSLNPAEMAFRFQAAGATRLHLVDLDGAKEGKIINLDAIEAIINKVSIPIQIGGGIRSQSSVEQLIKLGVSRVILGTVAVENPDLISSLCQKFPKQIVVGIDARDGKVATRGWLETTETNAVELGQKMSQLGAAAIIYTDIGRDGTLKGPNLNSLRELCTQVEIPVIASGGVSNLNDLFSLIPLEQLGVEGVIIGKAIYTGALDLKEAVRAVGPARLQDVPTNLDNTRLV
jgi:phosphoribosylformimino-5-aminoimidazole carboxamide ribotide isomerase